MDSIAILFDFSDIMRWKWKSNPQMKKKSVIRMNTFCATGKMCVNRNIMGPFAASGVNRNLMGPFAASGVV